MPALVSPSRDASLWQRWQFHLSALMLIVPIVSASAFFQADALFGGKKGLGQRDIGEVVVGPWTARMAEFKLIEPEAEGRAGYTKSFVMALCPACVDLANVSGSMPALWEAGILRHANTDMNAEVIATTAEFRTVHNWDTAKGMFFTKEDEVSGNAVMLLGATLALKLFPNIADTSGSHVLVNNIPFLVTGVLESKGLSEKGMDRDNNVVMPLRTAAMRLYGKDELSEIVVSIADMSRLQQTKDAIKSLLIRRHGREDFWLHDAASAFRKAEDERRSSNLLLGAIAAISMLVGGIGIMNIMLITVAERTREIGVRAAIGARTADILGQFLTEAIVLSAIGGVFGLLLGVLIGIAAATLFGMTVIFSITAAIGAVTGAVVMGTLFGFMPAFCAARLDPVVALSSQ